MKRGDKFGLVRILNLIKSGLSPSTISKQYSINSIKKAVKHHNWKVDKNG